MSVGNYRPVTRGGLWRFGRSGVAFVYLRVLRGSSIYVTRTIILIIMGVVGSGETSSQANPYMLNSDAAIRQTEIYNDCKKVSSAFWSDGFSF